MEVPLPTCFATLRKGVDGNNANDGYSKMGVVPGRKNCSPDCIQNFEHHTLKCWDGTLDDCELYVIHVQAGIWRSTQFFLFFQCCLKVTPITLAITCNYTCQSSSQFPACWGTLGPPAGRLIMILSTLRTETAASVAKRIAHALAAKESTTLFSAAFTVPSVSAWSKNKQNKISYRKGLLAPVGVLTSTSTPHDSPPAFSCLASNRATISFPSAPP